MKKFRPHLAVLRMAVVAGSLLAATLSVAQDCCDADTSCTQCVSDCCCSDACRSDFWTRSQLTGDWLGHRTALGQSGITLDADVTQLYQGVASGGLKQEFMYGGHGDYVLNFDGERLIGQEGLFLQMRGEHRFGEDVNTLTGGLMPAAGACET